MLRQRIRDTDTVFILSLRRHVMGGTGFEWCDPIEDWDWIE